MIDAVIIGGGPAGAAIGRTLASWGHHVLILTTSLDRSRGLAESLPPSTRKLLGRIGALDAVERAGFYRATGNTAWWASPDPRVERFGDTPGYQVFRPEFDRVLLDSAADAGADVLCDARVRAVRFDDAATHVDYELGGSRSSVDARIAIDCSGRAGVIGRRFRRYEAAHRTYAIVGVWQRRSWNLPDETHTVVETFDEGWAWSVPVDATTRHVGVMVDDVSSRAAAGVLESVYRAELANTRASSALLDGAALQRVWACDASLYRSDAYAGEHFLLVGDAASFIDPLSSFGVKKALASAWIGAVTANTWLLHANRAAAALDFFANWERQVYATNLKRSRDFARDAYERHPYPFWAARSAVEVEAAPGEIDEESLFGAPDVQAAFERLKTDTSLALAPGDAVSIRKRSLIHDREIVVEDAIALPEAPDGVRFIAGVDLLKLGEMACRHRTVSDLFDAYCRTCGTVSIRNLLGTLSLLVARRVLIPRE
jgi:flavin-dependent dehydrogenase